jgi:two-component system phosphate regulon response regulator PhoB
MPGYIASMRRILVVEDDPDLRELLTYDLTHEGFAIAATDLGAEALRLCQRDVPDLVLLDLMLPDYSGIEVCRALRRSPETKDVPIVFLTACGADADRIHGLEVGADDYVSKPFQMRELVLRIQALLKRAEVRTVAPISPRRVVHREQLRVWEGFAANHMGRAEWREAQEIWQAILTHFEGDLSPAELTRVREQIDGCERAMGQGRSSA